MAVKLAMKVSPSEEKLAKALSEGGSYSEVAAKLFLSPLTVKTYTEQLGQRIRGDLPAKAKVIIWYRIKEGLSVFTGEPLSQQ
jgi:hypothetical protein